jgi:HPt (histidine-containing phosphotransfer) domain-containing protein
MGEMQPLRSQYQDDPDMRDLVREFAAGLPERAAELERLFAAGQCAELGRIAHQLKGAGGGYGFPLITERAATLESSLKQGADEPRVKECLALLVEALRAVVAPEGD